jgi:glycosyl transferase family 4
MHGALPDIATPSDRVDGKRRPLRVLVAAHDFPPVASPQSLRTGRLVDGLLQAGFDVHVLTAQPPAGNAADAIEAPRHRALTVTRCDGHLLERIVSGLHVRRTRTAGAIAGSGDASADATGLNWKGRTIAHMRSLVGALAYPGLSRGWAANAAPRLRRLLREFQPDRVVLCHEPAAALLLAPIVQAAGVPWIAELGDPVCANYTPRRWRAQAAALQARICAGAAHVVLSSQATLEQLARDSGLDPRKASVLHQGFDRDVALSPAARSDAKLRLVYTGRFYRFRDPAALYAAVARTPGVELLIAQPPGGGSPAALPPNVIAVGEVRHARALELQASADVLVNIGNTAMPQLPGKFFEYFGLPTPVLHLTASAPDEQAGLLAQLRRGWVVRNDADAIAAQLQELLTLHRAGRLHEGLDLSAGPVADHAWPRIAGRFADLVAREYA